MIESKNKPQSTGFEVTADGVRMKLNIRHLEAEVILSETEIDGLQTTLTKAKEILRRATGKPIMPFAVLSESGTGRPLSPEERKNCVVDIPARQLIVAREGVIVHLGESEDGTETDQP